MSDKNSQERPKSLAEGAREFVKGILDAVSDVLFPAPAPVPVPVRVRGPRRR